MSPNTSETSTTPTQLRAVFGQNLRLLSQGHSTISSICRELAINRTQFNRYLSGESFPRPDVLHKICSFFETDARIILEPLDQIEAKNTNVLIHPELRAYFGPKETDISLKVFPTGFFSLFKAELSRRRRLCSGLNSYLQKGFSEVPSRDGSQRSGRRSRVGYKSQNP